MIRVRVRQLEAFAGRPFGIVNSDRVVRLRSDVGGCKILGPLVSEPEGRNCCRVVSNRFL